MLRQLLKSFGVARGLDLAALLETAGLDPTRRAEEIDGRVCDAGPRGGELRSGRRPRGFRLVDIPRVRRFRACPQLPRGALILYDM